MQGGTYYVKEEALTLEAARGVKALLDAGKGLQVQNRCRNGEGACHVAQCQYMMWLLRCLYCMLFTEVTASCVRWWRRSSRCPQRGAPPSRRPASLPSRCAAGKVVWDRQIHSCTLALEHHVGFCSRLLLLEQIPALTFNSPKHCMSVSQYSCKCTVLHFASCQGSAAPQAGRPGNQVGGICCGATGLPHRLHPVRLRELCQAHQPGGLCTAPP
jgi:hypothetical protein